jgi:Protein of unknown function (DUF3306)
MNEPDNFLSRWSRRKREAKAEPAGDPRHADETSADDGAEIPAQSPVSEPSQPPPPDFDVSSLPPIESIGADSDISAFMREGVPEALRHAALRRVWSADPAIRDFMGPTENFWDAAGPDGVPGFGPLDPGLDVKRMVAELFGETDPAKAKEEAPASAAVSVPSPEISHAPADDQPAREVDKDHLPRPTENVAVQTQSDQSQPVRKIARKHGGAMPQ